MENTLEKSINTMLGNVLYVVTNKREKVFCDKTIFKAYFSGELTFDEVKEKLKFNDLAQNNKPITKDGAIIDPGYIWLKLDNVCVLRDADRLIRVPYKKNDFIILQTD